MQGQDPFFSNAYMMAEFATPPKPVTNLSGWPQEDSSRGPVVSMYFQVRIQPSEPKTGDLGEGPPFCVCSAQSWSIYVMNVHIHMPAS